MVEAPLLKLVQRHLTGKRAPLVALNFEHHLWGSSCCDAFWFSGEISGPRAGLSTRGVAGDLGAGGPLRAPGGPLPGPAPLRGAGNPSSVTSMFRAIEVEVNLRMPTPDVQGCQPLEENDKSRNNDS